MSEESTPEYDKLIYEDMNKFLQFRVVVSNFRDVDYLHIRKYFLSYEGEWIPSKEGVSMPVTIDNVIRLTDALLDLCATAEGTDLFRKHFLEKFKLAHPT